MNKINNNINEITKLPELDFGSYPYSIWHDDRLNIQQIGILIFLYSERTSNEYIKIKKVDISNYCKMTRKTLTKHLKELKKLGWLEEIENKVYNLKTPDNLKQNNNDIEAKVKKNYQKYFGELLTPFNWTKIKTYIEDGLTYSLINEVIKYTARYSKNNATKLNYFFKILDNLLKSNITTKKQFLKANEKKYGKSRGGDNIGSKLSGKNKGNEKRKKERKEAGKQELNPFRARRMD